MHVCVRVCVCIHVCVRVSVYYIACITVCVWGEGGSSLRDF